MVFYQLLFTLFNLSAFASDQIVFITDSHGIGDFGVGIRKWLSSRSHTEFSYVASGGSAPLQWTNGKFTTSCGLKFTSQSKSAPSLEKCTALQTPKLSRLWASLNSHSKPSTRISIIALGTNFSNLESRKLAHIVEARALVEMALQSSDRCIWIGPPNMKRTPGFDEVGVQHKVDILLEAASSCEFIDSRRFTNYPEHGFDGIHYQWPLKNATPNDRLKTKEVATKWAQSVILQIEQTLKK